ncbi:hypothetical protein [Paraflavitalea speifideaquila]|uniref:hypothetical protein n=1 Tax=Paraflavitalea speifideaquila TaxID=3076558 RepID=UPI0028E5013B|nr:hypothetical protein [Paraflavitalea speifideiaquila]
MLTVGKGAAGNQFQVARTSGGRQWNNDDIIFALYQYLHRLTGAGTCSKIIFEFGFKSELVTLQRAQVALVKEPDLRGLRMQG